jgi:flagellar assembly protein FliH
MTSAAPFLFSTDFREDRRAKAPNEAEIALSRAEAHRLGHAEGHAQAKAEIDAELSAIVAAVLQQAGQLAARDEERSLALEEAAIHLAVTLARQLAGAALDLHPMAAIEAAARACLVHARTAPHLAIRVNDAMVEPVDRLFARLGRENGYAGKVIVLGDPQIGAAEARMEWADGGLVVDPAQQEQALATAISNALRPDP